MYRPYIYFHYTPGYGLTAEGREVRRGNLAVVKKFLDDGGDVETIGGRFHGTLLLESCRFRTCKVSRHGCLKKGGFMHASGIRQHRALYTSVVSSVE